MRTVSADGADYRIVRDEGALVRWPASKRSIVFVRKHVVTDGVVIPICGASAQSARAPVLGLYFPNLVRAIGCSCFSSSPRLARVAFESGSRLAQIDSYAFSDCSLESVVIPRAVEVLESHCFSSCRSLTHVTFESHSRLRVLGGFAFFDCALQNVIVPRAVEVVGTHCFGSCSGLRSIEFEENSRLRQIGEWAFSGPSVRCLTVPKSVQVVSGSAFCNASLASIAVEAGSAHLMVVDSILADRIRQKLIRYFGRSPSVTIGKAFIVIGPYCFSSCSSLESVDFEPGAAVRHIGDAAFHRCSIKRIIIPKSAAKWALPASRCRSSRMSHSAQSPRSASSIEACFRGQLCGSSSCRAR
jgi:hypothetical protein